MSTIELCSCLILDDQHCMVKSISAMNYGIHQDKQNLFIAQSKWTEHFLCTILSTLCTSIYLLDSALTDESISVNHHLTPPHRDYIHSMNDNVRRMDVFIHTQLLPIFNSYPHHLPIKLAQRSSFHSDCLIIVVIECIYKFKQVSLLNCILPNTWQRMSKYLEIYRWISVLGLVQVSWLSRFSHIPTNYL